MKNLLKRVRIKILFFLSMRRKKAFDRLMEKLDRRNIHSKYIWWLLCKLEDDYRIFIDILSEANQSGNLDPLIKKFRTRLVKIREGQLRVIKHNVGKDEHETTEAG